MDLRTYVLALWRRWPLLLVTAVLGTLAGTAAFVLTPPSYASEVQFYVSTPNVPGSNAQSSGLFAQARVNSYVQLLTSERMAREVITKTAVPLSPQAVSRRIEATTKINTVVITVTVTGGSPQQALLIAQGLAESFPELVDDLDNIRRDQPIVLINTISGPTVDQSPVAPNPLLYIGGGLAAGLLIGVIIALVRELSDTSVRTTEMAQREVGAPVLASIPYDGDVRRAPLMVGQRSRTDHAESMRQLRTNLRFIEATTSGNVALFTSAVPGEGKSVTAANLAVSFAETGDRVLLIETDLRRPQLGEIFDSRADGGLTDVLAGQVGLEQAIQPSPIEGVDLLTAGAIPPNPSELLSSERMKEIIATVRNQYDRVIIDSAPLLSVSDGVIASTVADVVILVLRYGQTARSDIALAVENLAKVDVQVRGTVLSMSQAKGWKQRRAQRTRGSGQTRPVPDWSIDHLQAPTHKPAEIDSTGPVNPSDNRLLTDAAGPDDRLAADRVDPLTTRHSPRG